MSQSESVNEEEVVERFFATPVSKWTNVKVRTLSIPVLTLEEKILFVLSPPDLSEVKQRIQDTFGTLADNGSLACAIVDLIDAGEIERHDTVVCDEDGSADPENNRSIGFALTKALMEKGGGKKEEE